MLSAIEHKEHMSLWLDAAIKALGISQVEVAQKCGVAPNTLNNYLRRQTPPNHYFLYQFAETYPITLDFLLRGKFEGNVAPVVASLKEVLAASSAA